MELRDYQIDLANKGTEILKELGIVYFAVAVRCGKTLTSLQTAQNYGAKNVLFLTKKKAIKSIQDDYNTFGFNFELTVINYESLHKALGNYDLIILDENHSNSAYPKPSKRTKEIKLRFSRLPMIMLSGTPTPESYSQWYHQFWMSINSPFNEWPTFYKWAAIFVDVKKKHLGFKVANDYSEAKIDLIKPIIEPYILTFTQEEAGFTNVINEHFITVKMKEITYQIASKLIKDKLFEGNTNTIIADTGSKLQSKLHQLYSGTIKLDEDNSCVIDDTKAQKIKSMFKGKKIAIFYKFIAEKKMLIETFGDLVTDSLDEFNSTGKSMIGQIQSIREGVKLDKAEALVYFNIDFASLSYFQGIDRATTIKRRQTDVYWFFSEGGIERKIYKSVVKKKNFTLSVFKKDYKLVY